MNNKPITTVYLCSVPLDIKHKNTIYFEDASSQYKYFASKQVIVYSIFNYQRKEGIISVPDVIDNIYNCNYVMYQNANYGTKWFYAFIKNMTYENGGTTNIEIELDVIQTWLFNYNVLPSFVEREHVTNDSEGLHTIPENLETGEYFCNEQIRDTRLQSLGIILAYSDYANSKYNVEGNVYGGVYSGMKYSYFPYTEEGITALNLVLTNYDKDAKAEGINSIFMCPVHLIFDPDGEQPGACTLGRTWKPYDYNITVTKNTKLNGYTPRNKKLLCYPYNYLYVSNNNGGSVLYQYEKFNTNNCEFEVQGCVTPGMSIKLHPMYYNNLGVNHDEGLNLGKYAVCCWNSDAFTNWLTANGVNSLISVGSSALSIAAGVVTGNPLAIGGGVIGVAQSLASVNQASKMPDQIKGNSNCGDVITGGKNKCYLFHKMSIKKEYAEIIDGFFDSYGYQVNSFKVPNTNHMKRYWYTKTKDANITGSIPLNDLDKIKECYDNGITFWKDTTNIGIYPTSNSDGSINNANR